MFRTLLLVLGTSLFLPAQSHDLPYPEVNWRGTHDTILAVPGHTVEYAYPDVSAGVYTKISFRPSLGGNRGIVDITYVDLEIDLASTNNPVRPLTPALGPWTSVWDQDITFNANIVTDEQIGAIIGEPFNQVITFDQPYAHPGGTLHLRISCDNYTSTTNDILRFDFASSVVPGSGAYGDDQPMIDTHAYTQVNCERNDIDPWSAMTVDTSTNDISLTLIDLAPSGGFLQSEYAIINIFTNPVSGTYVDLIETRSGIKMFCDFVADGPLLSDFTTSSVKNYNMGTWTPNMIGTSLRHEVYVYDAAGGGLSNIRALSPPNYNTIGHINIGNNATFGGPDSNYMFVGNQGIVIAPMIYIE